MADKDKNNSFLFQLYKKYIKKQEDADIHGDETAAQLIDEVLSEIETKETPEAVPMAEVPAEQAYLLPLYQLYLHCWEVGGLDWVGLDLRAFASRCLAPVALPGEGFAGEADGPVRCFERELCDKAADFLNTLEAERVDVEARRAAFLAQQATVIAEDEGDPLVAAEEGDSTQGSAPVDEESTDESLTPEEPKPIPRDSKCFTYLSKDKMEAYFFALPPLHGGKPLDAEGVMVAVAKEGIVYGLDEDSIARLASGEAYFQIWPIAHGTAPIQGKDGQLVPLVDCDATIEITENEQGIADYKNIHSILTATKGQVLCHIILPEKGIAGKTVKGAPVPAVDGKHIPDPRGKHTEYTQDQCMLLATLDGQITLRRGKYYVEPVLVIEGNVDYGVGNIDFVGDVVISGDICNGFTVKAAGSVTVRGMVESADIVAGGDVSIHKGMNGNYSGRIDAQGVVRTSFLENCTVYCEGALYANSIVTSKVYCGDTVYVLDRHGAIIGGTIVAFKSVEAKVIGSQSRRETDIILGERPHLNEKKTQAEAELDSTSTTLEMLDKNVNYLTGLEASLPPEKLALLQQLKQQQILYRKRKDELTELLDEIANDKRDLSACRVKCGLIFPPTRITIGTHTHLIPETETKSLIYLTRGGIVVGTL